MTMALVKKTAAPAATSQETGKPSAVAAREADAQRKRARTLAKQQQAPERIAAATAQLASGINGAASAAEELKRASDQIVTGAEEASGASQEWLAAFLMDAIVVSNRKGGTRKTTVAVNVAAELAARGRRVLFIDPDSQGHGAVGLGVKVCAGGTAVHRPFVDPAARRISRC
jgi:methyl-accepting chemotaxis protein